MALRNDTELNKINILQRNMLEKKPLRVIKHLIRSTSARGLNHGSTSCHVDQPFHSAYEKFIEITDHLSSEMAATRHSAIEASLETDGRELLRLLLQII